MDKDNVVYMYNGIALSLKKKRERENIATCNNTDEPGGYYAKLDKPEVDTIPYDRTHM